MKKVIWGLALTAALSSGCASTQWSQLTPAQKAVVIIKNFEASWDEACTTEWLSCDATAKADAIAEAAVRTIQANPVGAKQIALTAISQIQMDPLIVSAIGKWKPWLDVAAADITLI